MNLWIQLLDGERLCYMDEEAKKSPSSMIINKIMQDVVDGLSPIQTYVLYDYTWSTSNNKKRVISLWMN